MSAEEERFDAVVSLAARIAAGELDARLPSSDADDDIDALITALNMLGEELGHQRRARVHAEELLADELDTYENAPALFCSLDAETLAIEKCNETLAHALERPKAQLIGTCVLELCEPACRLDAERLLRDQPGARPGPGELTLQTSSKRSLIVATSVSRIHNGERARLRIVWKDVTAEKHLEAQLLQAQKMDAIGRLSGGVAHDFNNILAVITTAAEFLCQTLSAHRLPLADAQLVLDAAARGAALTNDLLAFSRQRVVRPVPTDLRVVVRETERMVVRLMGDPIQVVSDLAAEPVVCLIDPAQVSQVLLNLAINARDAMPNGGMLGFEVTRLPLANDELSARLELPPGGQYALITVRDRGIGMTPDVLSKAFEPFFTTKPVGQGTGLGLSMCYGIVRQAGGRIALDSELGCGTTVRIYLPLAAADLGTDATRVSANETGAGTVLLVEDDAILRILGKRILESGGYHVLLASNGREALEVAAGFRGEIALLVTDVMMPELGGQQLAMQLQAARPSLRVLYVSGFTANVIVNQGVLNPGVAFLAKPFTSSALLAGVRQVLDAGRAAPER